MHFHLRFIGLLLIASSISGLSCYSDAPVEAVSDRFYEGYRQSFETEQSPLLVFSGLPARLDTIRQLQHTLGTLDTHYLSRPARQKRQELGDLLKREWAQWAPYSVDPSLYNLGGLLKKELINTTDTPPAARINELLEIMQQAPDYYTAARQNLRVEDVSLYRLAAQKQYLALEFLNGELKDSLAGFAIPEPERQAFEQQVVQTETALKDYLAFCESVYLNYQDSTHYRQPDRSLRKARTGR